MGLPSNSYVRIPKRVRPGEEIKAKDFNALVDALRALTQRGIPQPRGNTSGGGERDPFWSSIVTIPDSDPVEYAVTFQLGYLTYQSALATEADQPIVGYIVPKIDGIAMDDPLVEPLPLPGLANFVYLRVKTTEDGEPQYDAITIEAFDSEQESIHHVRDSPTSEVTEGDYFFLLLETESNGATPTPAPRVKRRITGNRYLPNQMVKIKNIGGEREVYKGYNVGPADDHDFRTLKNLEARGEPIIKELEVGQDEEDTLPFRRIDGRATQRQISVTNQGDVIQVEGNGYYTTEGNVRKFSISIADGLISSFLKDGELTGWWGDVRVEYQPVMGSTQFLTMRFNDGTLVQVFRDSSDPLEGEPGTEGTPGNVSITISDTDT